MNEQMRAGMEEATRLTRAGRLLEATALIQRTLRGSATTRSHNPDDSAADPDIIEGTFRVVEPDATASANPAPPQRIIALPGPVAEAQPGAAPSRATPMSPDAPRLPQQRRSHPATPTPPTPVPPQTSTDTHSKGRFIAGSYTNAAGARAYKLYIPSGYHGQALPLVVMLHGCTQTPDDFAVGTRMNAFAEQRQFLVVYPAQTARANGSKCWNWFKATEQQHGHGEPSIIAGITEQIISGYHCDHRRVYIAGFSAGGAMALIMTMTYPDLYAAGGVHSGLAYGAAHDLASALAAMQCGSAGAPANRRGVPLIVFHGDQDTTVHQCNGAHVIAQALHGRADGSRPTMQVQRGQAPDGHAYTRSTYHAANGQTMLEQWLIHGAGHAWSGGSSNGSFTDARGPDATQEMLRFFNEHTRQPR